MLWSLYYKGIADIDSIQGMAKQFKDETFSKIYLCLLVEMQGNTFLIMQQRMDIWKMLNPMELEDVKWNLV